MPARTVIVPVMGVIMPATSARARGLHAWTFRRLATARPRATFAGLRRQHRRHAFDAGEIAHDLFRRLPQRLQFLGPLRCDRDGEIDALVLQQNLGNEAEFDDVALHVRAFDAAQLRQDLLFGDGHEIEPSGGTAHAEIETARQMNGLADVWQMPGVVSREAGIGQLATVWWRSASAYCAGCIAPGQPLSLS